MIKEEINVDLGLQGKTVIITGGSKGIGLASALSLAAEGAKVSIVARGLDSLKKAANLIFEKTGMEPLKFRLTFQKRRTLI